MPVVALPDVVDLEQYRAAVAAGLIRVRQHPDLPYSIHNYTDACTWNDGWNDATIACRGLITDDRTGQVIARPFRKFFNHDQPQAPVFDLDQDVVVMEKADGCFPGGTLLRLWDGGAIPIEAVVSGRLPVVLAGVDASGSLVPSRVTDWHDNGMKARWLDVVVSGPGGIHSVRVTPNHRVMRAGEYVPAGDLRFGDALVTLPVRPGEMPTVPATVVSAEPAPGAPSRAFDISTETVNYFAAGILVHNSLGISYPRPDGSLAIATRGSFTSEQAEWANALYAREYADRFDPDPRWTYLFEIIAPFNRIVVDYGDTEDLVLLGAVDIGSGRSVPLELAASRWPGPAVEVHPHTTLRQVLQAPARRNAEGFVLWDPVSDSRIKYKFDDYKRLHRFLTGTTERHVWEVLAAGQDPAEAFAGAPDEFHGWLREVVAGLRAQHAGAHAAATAEFASIRAELGPGAPRREFAARASASPNRSLLFLLLDGKDINEPIWRSLRPAGGTTVRSVSSDAD